MDIANTNRNIVNKNINVSPENTKRRRLRKKIENKPYADDDDE